MLETKERRSELFGRRYALFNPTIHPPCPQKNICLLWTASAGNAVGETATELGETGAVVLGVASPTTQNRHVVVHKAYLPVTDRIPCLSRAAR